MTTKDRLNSYKRHERLNIPIVWMTELDFMLGDSVSCVEYINEPLFDMGYGVFFHTAPTWINIDDMPDTDLEYLYKWCVEKGYTPFALIK